jgi:hypothetical protein
MTVGDLIELAGDCSPEQWVAVCRFAQICEFAGMGRAALICAESGQHEAAQKIRAWVEEAKK